MNILSFNRAAITLFLFLLSSLHIGNLGKTVPVTPNHEEDAYGFRANGTDHFALLAIKSKIIDDPRGVLSAWNDSQHFCHWQGVTCGRRHKRVIALNLSSNALVGSLSPYIGNLSFLREVWLEKNALGGEIPAQVGQLFRLKVLRLAENSFGGEIPANLSQCSNLVDLSLGINKLVGKIPKEFTSLIMLRNLQMQGNSNLTGGIPPFIGNLTLLQVINIGGCQLGGSIPNIFHQLKRLWFVGLGANGITGTIPQSLYNLSSLEVLNIPRNQLGGRVPINLGLRRLEIGANNFTGSLPPSISNCSQLEILDVSRNKFYGKIAVNFGGLKNLTNALLAENNFGSGEPDEMKFMDYLANCSSLERLDMVFNRLQGVVSDSIGNFSTKLRHLGLGDNSISGTLPSSIGNLVSLSYLALGVNQFTGTIPDSIGKLQNLQRLGLWSNNFMGRIPDSIGNLSLLSVLGLGENKLEGLITSSLGKCSSLTFLGLYRNNLSGSIPAELFRLLPLALLELNWNNLSGPLPLEIGNLRNLNELDVSGNALSGELPSTLGDCTSLVLLSLAGNLFQGSIPASLGSLRGLRYLNLSSNNFSMQIPTFLEQIPLEVLDLSFNNFEGEVPIKGVFANASAMSLGGNNRLCGGIPELQLPKCRKEDTKEHKKLSLALILVISIVSTLSFIAMVSFVLYFCCKKRGIDHPSRTSSKEPLLNVSYEMLLKATDGFSSENLIGEGSFASVYKGVLQNGMTTVAIKVLNLQRPGGFKSFVAECEALRNVRHRNLVKVITSCSSVNFQGDDFKAIVYEFMPNGSLDEWLHSINSKQIGLLHRVNIAIDVACALDYLHYYCRQTLVHCDLKPSNVLLSNDMVAHVADFGLAKFIPPETSKAPHSSSVGMRGTVGYAAPEYGLGNEVSTKGDIYSYGILLLEMVTGKKPTDPMFKEGLNIHNYANTAYPNNVLDIVDPVLLKDEAESILPGGVGNQHSLKNRNNTKDCLTSLVRIGVACSMESPQDRMDISRVMNELHSVRDTIVGT